MALRVLYSTRILEASGIFFSSSWRLVLKEVKIHLSNKGVESNRRLLSSLYNRFEFHFQGQELISLMSLHVMSIPRPDEARLALEASKTLNPSLIPLHATSMKL
jgi:hypothetical protein